MDTLSEIIKAVRKMITKPKSRCTILSSDGIFESSLMGTKEGYLNFIITLLEFVAACEEPLNESIDLDRFEDENAFWSDNLRKALNQLPGSHAYLIGSYIFDDHQSFLTALEKEVDSTLHDGAKLRNDPAFKEP